MFRVFPCFLFSTWAFGVFGPFRLLFSIPVLPSLYYLYCDCALCKGFSLLTISQCLFGLMRWFLSSRDRSRWISVVLKVIEVYFFKYRLYITEDLVSRNAKREINFPESQLCLQMPSSECVSNCWEQTWIRVLYPREAAGKICWMLSVPFLWVLDLVFVNKNPWITSATYQQVLVKAPYPEEFANFRVLSEPATAPHLCRTVSSWTLACPPLLKLGNESMQKWKILIPCKSEKFSLVSSSSANVKYTQDIQLRFKPWGCQADFMNVSVKSILKKKKNEVWERLVQFNGCRHDIHHSQICSNILDKYQEIVFFRQVGCFWRSLLTKKKKKKKKEEKAVRIANPSLLSEKQRGWKGGAAGGCAGWGLGTGSMGEAWPALKSGKTQWNQRGAFEKSYTLSRSCRVRQMYMKPYF